MLNKIIIEARDIPDLWFQAIYNVLDHGRRFVIDRGSYSGQTRLEYDYFIGHIKNPGARPIIPEIPPTVDIPPPVTEEYMTQYIQYLMTNIVEPGESYTYGQRLTGANIDRNILIERMNIDDSKIVHEFDINSDKNGQAVNVKNSKDAFLNQIEYIIYMYKNHGHRNNQLVLQIAQPGDLLLYDPPCLRSIDTRIQDGKLHFFVYFRSWDLWAGLPANLAGIQTLKEYMADSIGVEDGEMIVESKGLHLYGYAEDLAKIRTFKTD